MRNIVWKVFPDSVHNTQIKSTYKSVRATHDLYRKCVIRNSGELSIRDGERIELFCILYSIFSLQLRKFFCIYIQVICNKIIFFDKKSDFTLSINCRISFRQIAWHKLVRWVICDDNVSIYKRVSKLYNNVYNDRKID